MINLYPQHKLTANNVNCHKTTFKGQLFNAMNSFDTVSFSGKSQTKIQQYTHKDVFELEKLRSRADKAKPETLASFYQKWLELAEKDFFYPQQNLQLAKQTGRIKKDSDIEDLQFSTIQQIRFLAEDKKDIDLDKYLSFIDKEIQPATDISNTKINIINACFDLIYFNKSTLSDVQKIKFEKILEKAVAHKSIAPYKSGLMRYSLSFTQPETNLQFTRTNIGQMNDEAFIEFFNEQFNKMRGEFSDFQKFKSTCKGIDKLLRVAIEFNVNLQLDPDTCISLLSKHFNYALGLYNNNKDNQEVIDCIASLSSIADNVYKVMDEKNVKKEIETFFFNLLTKTDYTDLSYIAERFFSKISQNVDPDFHKLVQITNNIKQIDDYKSPQYIQARSELFNQELKIVLQELTEPEKYLDRAIKMMAFQKVPKDRQEAIKLMKNNSFHAIYAAVNSCKELDIVINDDLKDILVDSLTNALVNKDFNVDSKHNAICSLLLIFDHCSVENKQKIEQALTDNISLFTDRVLANRISSFFNKFSDKEHDGAKFFKAYLLEQYKNADDSTRNEALITLVKSKTPEVKGIISDILKTPDSYTTELYNTAVWACGIHTSNANFKQLVNIINPKRFETIKTIPKEEMQLVETALYSLAEYDDKRVPKILKLVSNSSTDIAETAQALLEKLKDKTSNEKDFFIRKNLQHHCKSGNYLSEVDKYKNLRNEFVLDFNSFTLEEQNWIDNTLLPFRSVLAKLVKINKHTEVLYDMPTANVTGQIGKRLGSSFFNDSAGGLGGTGITIDKKSFVIPSGGCFVFGHEWGHCIHNHLKEKEPELAKEIDQLYEKAKKNGFMDYYAEINPTEYFAQANEAYLSVYKPHKSLIEKNTYSDDSVNTRLKLKQIDPEMFKFIERLYAKFNQISINKAINIVA